MVQSGNGVDDPKHDSSFDPVVHQIGVGQAGWNKNRSQKDEEDFILRDTVSPEHPVTPHLPLCMRQTWLM